MKKDRELEAEMMGAASASGLSWQLFTATGNIGYYLLYRDLTDEE